jgi:hypothetical protein
MKLLQSAAAEAAEDGTAEPNGGDGSCASGSGKRKRQPPVAGRCRLARA